MKLLFQKYLFICSSHNRGVCISSLTQKQFLPTVKHQVRCQQQPWHKHPAGSSLPGHFSPGDTEQQSIAATCSHHRQIYDRSNTNIKQENSFQMLYILSVQTCYTTVWLLLVNHDFIWIKTSLSHVYHLFIMLTFPHFCCIFLWLNNCRCERKTTTIQRKLTHPW